MKDHLQNNHAINQMHNTVSLPFVYVDVSHKKANIITKNEAWGNI
jgi:hypothetical protein